LAQPTTVSAKEKAMRGGHGKGKSLTQASREVYAVTRELRK
jgi:hypothetical protein